MKFNYDSDCFDEYDGAEMLQVAQDRRQNGRLKQVDINAFNEGMKSALEVGNNFDTPEENILIDFIHANPDQIDNLKEYVTSQGYGPAMSLIDLCMQVAHARNEQINKVVDKYDSDNFSFATAAGKERRRKRREARKARKSGASDSAPQEEEQAADNKAIPKEPGKMIIDNPDTAFQAGGVAPQGTNIAPDEAHAEILGQESEMEEYDGEQDKFLPVLMAAIALGTKTVNAVKEAKKNGQKVNLKSFADLFKKKAQEVANEAIANVETAKKKDFVRENLPLMVVGVLALVFIGSQIK